MHFSSLENAEVVHFSLFDGGTSRLPRSRLSDVPALGSTEILDYVVLERTVAASTASFLPNGVRPSQQNPITIP